MSFFKARIFLWKKVLSKIRVGYELFLYRTFSERNFLTKFYLSASCNLLSGWTPSWEETTVFWRTRSSFFSSIFKVLKGLQDLKRLQSTINNIYIRIGIRIIRGRIQDMPIFKKPVLKVEIPRSYNTTDKFYIA